MCGIVGYLGAKEARPILIDCLGRLEYRGYDSAGMATVAGGRLATLRSVGKNTDLQALLELTPLNGTVGIAHTRWATHGKPSNANAHPHTDCSHSVAIVHNGIIENYREVRETLQKSGHRFTSETDSEVIAHLVESGNGVALETAVRNAIPMLHGAYAIAVISQNDPDKVVVVRNGGPPLVIGYRDDGWLIASDITAILHYTRDIQILEDGDLAVVTREGVRVTRPDGSTAERARTNVTWESTAAEKNGYPTFMLKEIHEQPQAILDTVQRQVLPNSGGFGFPDAAFTQTEEFRDIKQVELLACGSSLNAALVGRYYIEAIAHIPTVVDIASEYRFRPHIDQSNGLAIGISQSGETADTLAALRQAKSLGDKVLLLCNVAGSSMSREVDGVIYTHAGPEIGVASTKTFTCQVVALLMFAIALGRARDVLSQADADTLLLEIKTLPALIARVLAREELLETLARQLADSSNALYLGRGVYYPLAIEGALKLKEISYIHAEGCAAGELKHGPIALIDARIPVIVIVPMGPLHTKVLAAIEEVKARDGQVIALASEGDTSIAAVTEQVFYLPQASDLITPILVAVALQLLAYHVAMQRGCDVDKPRNLAKSVTVE